MAIEQEAFMAVCSWYLTTREECAMNAFVGHHENSIQFGYRCFDELSIMGVPPAKLHEKPAVGSAGGLASGCTGRPATRSPALPVRCAGFSTLLGWAFRPRKKNWRLVAPAVSPLLALADRRQDRRRYPFAVPVFRPCWDGRSARERKTGGW